MAQKNRKLILMNKEHIHFLVYKQYKYYERYIARKIYDM
jgi:hypothetical protein